MGPQGPCGRRGMLRGPNGCVFDSLHRSRRVVNFGVFRRSSRVPSATSSSGQHDEIRSSHWDPGQCANKRGEVRQCIMCRWVRRVLPAVRGSGRGSDEPPHRSTLLRDSTDLLCTLLRIVIPRLCCVVHRGERRRLRCNADTVGWVGRRNSLPSLRPLATGARWLCTPGHRKRQREHAPRRNPAQSTCVRAPRPREHCWRMWRMTAGRCHFASRGRWTVRPPEPALPPVT